LSKYRNPFFGYKYNLTQPDPSVDEFDVIFTNGKDVQYPIPNMTETFYPDYSSLLQDEEGNRYFIFNDYMSSAYQYFHYTSSDYNNTWLEMLTENSTIEQTTWTDDKCVYFQNKYNDYSQDVQVAHICNNGSYLLFPSAWTN